MATSIFANPGQTITIGVQVTDTYGTLLDSDAPTVDFILMPDGSMAAGYPASMTQIVTGVWRHSLTIPSGLGSYIISCSVPMPTGDPDKPIPLKNELFMLNVALPFGNVSILPS